MLTHLGEILLAAADGKEIEYFTDNDWVDWDNPQPSDAWSLDYAYRLRIKPPRREYWHVELHDMDVTFVTQDKNNAMSLQSEGHYVMGPLYLTANGLVLARSKEGKGGWRMTRKKSSMPCHSEAEWEWREWDDEVG
jgi:hypothetical protein